jgi:hypothetical protein
MASALTYATAVGKVLWSEARTGSGEVGNSAAREARAAAQVAVGEGGGGRSLQRRQAGVRDVNTAGQAQPFQPARAAPSC